MNDDCKRFMEDPERERAHAESCADCRKFLVDLDRLDADIASTTVESNVAARVGKTLPLAPWEGAHHRSWALTLAIAAGVILLTIGAFFAGGVSPIAGIVETVRNGMATPLGWITVVRSLPRVLSRAPMPFHFFVVAAFVLINVLLYLLLRRAPKGYDAASR
jgi:hypothetical protein